MENPKAGGAGEGNSNGDKGKVKMEFPSSVTSMGDIPFPPFPDLHKYELLAESLHKQMLDIKAWKEASKASKEGEKEEEEEEESPQVLRQHEEREKIKLLQKDEPLRNERRQLKQQAKMEEDNVKAN